MALLNVNANVDISNDARALTRATSRSINRLRAAVARKSSYEAAKSMKKWLNLAMSCDFHDIRLHGPTDDEVRAFRHHKAPDTAIYYAAMSGQVLDAINRRLAGRVFIKFADTLFDERLEGDMELNNAISGVASMIRNGRRIARAHISNKSSIIQIHSLPREQGGLQITLPANHHAMLAVEHLDELPGVKTTAVYRFARLFFGLARLTWKDCYIQGTRADRNKTSRSSEFQRDETAVMNVSIHDRQVTINMTLQTHTRASRSHTRWVADWNKDFRRFSQTVEYYLRAKRRMRILLTASAIMAYNIDIGGNCEADILFQQLQTISGLAYREDSDSESSSSDDEQPANPDPSGLIQECLQVSNGAMLLSSIRNRIFSDSTVQAEQAKLGPTPDFGSCSVARRRENRGVTGSVSHVEVNTTFMNFVLRMVGEYDFGETVENFDFLSTVDYNRLEGHLGDLVETLGFLTPEFHTDHNTMMMDYCVSRFGCTTSEDKTLLWSAVMAEIAGLSSRHESRRFSAMGRKSTLHRNENSMLFLAKEPKTVCLYGTEAKWFEQSEYGGLMLEHETNDAVKLIALTCALYHEERENTGYKIPATVRNIVRDALKEGWSVSSAVRDLRRMKCNLDAEKGSINLTAKFNWLKNHGVLLRGTEFDNVLERECIAEELHMAEKYRSNISENGCYIDTLLRSRADESNQNRIDVKYDDKVPAEGLRVDQGNGTAKCISDGTVVITIANRAHRRSRTIHHIALTNDFCSGLENFRFTESDYLDDRFASGSLTTSEA